MSPPPPTADALDKPAWLVRLHRLEDGFNLSLLVVMAVLPVLEIFLRLEFVEKTLGIPPVPGSAQFVSLLTLWIGFTGAVLAARDGRHLSLASGLSFIPDKLVIPSRVIAIGVAAAATAVLAYGAFVTADAERASTAVLPGGVPVWITQLIMPIGYALVAARLILKGFDKWWLRGLVAALVVGILVFAYSADFELAEKLVWPGVVLVLIATILGGPIYVALGGAALLLFWADDTPVAAVAAETVRQIKNPTMPTIPLFTFAGYILAESKASTRLVAVVRGLVGWLPGGVAIMTAVVCAFFTTFTGASGVTILALGGLLYPMLVKEKYPENFSVGLLTASGSIGLLFPPALPVIFYAVIAHVPVDRMFVAGLLPGCVLVGAISAYGVFTGVRAKVTRTSFDMQTALRAVWVAKWELAIPLITLGGFFGGLTTIVEAAALTAAYTLFIETVVYKDLSLKKDLVRIGGECSTLIGGVLIILGVAMGFTSYLVDADVPSAMLDWVKGGIESKYVFLIALNVFLLIVGCLMDIFSAIVVVVPLIMPISRHFGIDPIHLGIIFLANLELGYLTPPVGMNLFLSSFRFEKPLTEVYRVAIPFLIVLIIAVLLITYVPALTLAPVEWVYGSLPEPPPIDF